MITKAAVACVLVVGAFAAWQTNELRLTELALLEHQNSSLRMRARAVDVAVEEGNRRTAAVQKEVEDARKKVDALEVAAAGAADAGRSLRDQLAIARRASCPKPSDSPTAGGSSAPEAAERVLTDVQRRLDEAQEAVAKHADRSRVAGLACEGSYRALTP